MEFRRVLFRSRNRFLDTPNTVAAEFNPQLQFSARYLLLENSQPALQFSLRNYSSIYIVGSEIAVSQPVLWSAINQAISHASQNVYSFSAAQPTKFRDRKCVVEGKSVSIRVDQVIT